MAAVPKTSNIDKFESFVGYLVTVFDYVFDGEIYLDTANPGVSDIFVVSFCTNLNNHLTGKKYGFDLKMSYYTPLNNEKQITDAAMYCVSIASDFLEKLKEETNV